MVPADFLSVSSIFRTVSPRPPAAVSFTDSILREYALILHTFLRLRENLLIRSLFVYTLCTFLLYTLNEQIQKIDKVLL